MSNSIIEWTAKSVASEILNSGRTKQWVSDQTGIPYPTLNRKLAGKTEFKFSELFDIAQLLGVRPSEFTPPVFKDKPAEKVSA